MVGKKKNYAREIALSFIGILSLVVLVFGVSYAVWTRSITGSKINTLSSGYLSFNYVESDINVINMPSALPVDDETGKNVSSRDSYFEATISNNFKKKINYEILLDPVYNEIDSKYIKVYLTDKFDEPLAGFEGEVLTLDKFLDEETERFVIYQDTFLSDKDSLTFKLRVWLSEDFEVKDYSSAISFKVNVRGSV